MLVGALHGVLQRLVVHRALRGLDPQEDVPTLWVDALEVEPAEPLWRDLGSDVVVPEWWIWAASAARLAKAAALFASALARCSSVSPAMPPTKPTKR